MYKTRGDLFEAFTKIVRMCEGTKLNPNDGVKQSGSTLPPSTPAFNGDPDSYTFAIGIVENRFVFEGDVLYFPDGERCTINKSTARYLTKLSRVKPEVKPDIVATGCIFYSGGNTGIGLGLQTTHAKHNVELIFHPDGTFKDVRRMK